MEIARQLGDDHLLAQSLGYRSLALMAQPFATELIECGHQLREVADRSSDRSARANMHTAFIQGYGMLGPRDQLDLAWDNAIADFPTNRPFVGPMDWVPAYRAFMTGRCDDALDEAERAFETTRLEGAGSWAHLIEYLLPIAWLQDRIATIADRMDDAYRAVGGTQLRLALALTLAAIGETDRAAAVFDRTTPEQLDISYSTAAGVQLSFSYSQLALALRGHHRLAAAAWTSKLPNLAASATSMFSGANRLHSAALHQALGDTTQSVAHYQQAHDLHREWKATPFLVRGLIDHARVLIGTRQGSPILLLDEALQHAASTQLTSLQETAMSLRRSLEPHP